MNCRIQETNVLTKFHEDWAKNVYCRLLTYFHYIHIEKTAPHPGGHVFPPMMTIFELVRDIYTIDAKIVTSRENDPQHPGGHKTHFLTKFHEDWTKNVTSSWFTCFHYIRIENTAPPLDGHVFYRSRPFSNSSEISIKPMFRPSFMMMGQKLLIYIHIMNTAPLPGGHVFQRTETIFEPTYYLHKHFDKFLPLMNQFQTQSMNTAPPPGGHVFQRTGTIFEVNQHIIETNIFELSRGTIVTNVLTKFHEDRTINVASRVFTRQNVDDGRRTTDKRRSQKLTMVTGDAGRCRRLASREFKHIRSTRRKPHPPGMWTTNQINMHSLFYPRFRKHASFVIPDSVPAGFSGFPPQIKTMPKLKFLQ
ncbi:hypothetical protein DPMN_162170 [Dreissena polymorpha]|uniref:Uncharacterized protein n=1 Tax=Dreissena polymorpha TaxID=45954 RepID=A0A9D4EUK8_DREPO|nr:hypothetical protein DPMN_162170 [Dreissena polymorpha]